MRLKQAAFYSSIGKQQLIHLARNGHIKGFQDPDDKRQVWIFDRLSLDEYRESQAQKDYQKALAIMGETVV
jgi:hypothetical protein